MLMFMMFGGVSIDVEVGFVADVDAELMKSGQSWVEVVKLEFGHDFDAAVDLYNWEEGTSLQDEIGTVWSNRTDIK